MPLLLCSPRLEALDAPCVLGDGPAPPIVRRTDPGNDGLVQPALHTLPDLSAIRVGRWAPTDPEADLFAGRWDDDDDGLFLRLEVIVAGRVNPPGLLDCDLGFFDPFLFGDHPVYGFIDMDVDGDVDTGGELASADLRYLGNAARFGGLPTGLDDDLANRVARRGADLDGDCDTDPGVEFSGEEFHLAIFGEEYGAHRVIEGDGDGLFESGETWELDGTWLHRAHGFEDFSLACGSDVGIYDPPSTIRFVHDAEAGETRIILVFPFTNEGSSLMRGDQQVEPNNCDPFDQSSIEEALWDLTCSGCLARESSRPCKRIIVDWCDEDACADGDPQVDFDPCGWSITALLGASYAQSEDGCYVWTDVYPEGLPGDVTGDGKLDDDDRAAVMAFIGAEDGGSGDADGVVNGVVVLGNFSLDFALYDVNYNGAVSAGDLPRGDLDDDGDVDLDDWTLIAGCLAGPGIEAAGVCERADFDLDRDVDLHDMAGFQEFFGGGGD